MSGKTATHGSVGMYTNHRCRCIPCKAAQAAYIRRYRAEHGRKRYERPRRPEQWTEAAADTPRIYVHPDDADVADATREDLEVEIDWLRGQRSVLAAALDRIGRGDDSAPIVAAVFAELGVTSVARR